MYLTGSWTYATCVYTACHGVYGWVIRDDYNDDNNACCQTDLAAQGVAVQGPQLGDALHPGLSNLPLYRDGSWLHCVADNQSGQTSDSSGSLGDAHFKEYPNIFLCF